MHSVPHDYRPAQLIINVNCNRHIYLSLIEFQMDFGQSSRCATLPRPLANPCWCLDKAIDNVRLSRAHIVASGGPTVC